MLTTWPRRLWGSRRCPICGAANYACGGPTDVVGVDQRMEHGNMAERGKLQTVEVTNPVTGRKTKLRLSPEKAARYRKPAARERPKPRPPETETRARQPQTRAGDVETK